MGGAPSEIEDVGRDHDRIRNALYPRSVCRQTSLSHSRPDPIIHGRADPIAYGRADSIAYSRAARNSHATPDDCGRAGGFGNAFARRSRSVGAVSRPRRSTRAISHADLQAGSDASRLHFTDPIADSRACAVPQSSSRTNAHAVSCPHAVTGA